MLFLRLCLYYCIIESASAYVGVKKLDFIGFMYIFECFRPKEIGKVFVRYKDIHLGVRLR
jgi:hypothetical protein